MTKTINMKQLEADLTELGVSFGDRLAHAVLARHVNAALAGAGSAEPLRDEISREHVRKMLAEIRRIAPEFADAAPVCVRDALRLLAHLASGDLRLA